MSNWLVTYKHPAFPGTPREMIVIASSIEEATANFEKASNRLGFRSDVTEYLNLESGREPELEKGALNA